MRQAWTLASGRLRARITASLRSRGTVGLRRIAQVSAHEPQSRLEEHRLWERVRADWTVSENREAVFHSERHGPVIRIHETEQRTARDELIFGEQLAVVSHADFRQKALRMPQDASDPRRGCKADDRIVVNVGRQRILAQPGQADRPPQAFEHAAVARPASADFPFAKEGIVEMLIVCRERRAIDRARDRNNGRHPRGHLRITRKRLQYVYCAFRIPHENQRLILPCRNGENLFSDRDRVVLGAGTPADGYDLDIESQVFGGGNGVGECGAPRRKAVAECASKDQHSRAIGFLIARDHRFGIGALTVIDGYPLISEVPEKCVAAVRACEMGLSQGFAKKRAKRRAIIDDFPLPDDGEFRGGELAHRPA